MKCAFLGTKIAASFETAKRNLLKNVKGFEKVRYNAILSHLSLEDSFNGFLYAL